MVRLALGFEFLINEARQENAQPGRHQLPALLRGARLQGVGRAHFAFLERSIEKGPQFAVFEPNEPVLWANTDGQGYGRSQQ